MKIWKKNCIRVAVSGIMAFSLAVGSLPAGLIPASGTQTAQDAGAEAGAGVSAGASDETEGMSGNSITGGTGATKKGVSAFGAQTEDETEAETETEAGSSEPVKRERVILADAEDLKALAKRCMVDTASKDLEVVLTADILLSGKGFTPIPYFAGIFDGQGHTVRGMVIRQNGSNLGLFRYVGAGAVIRNLNVEGRIEPGGSAKNLGGIAGSNAGTIQSCSFRGSVRALEGAGGIAGTNTADGSIMNCFFEGKAVSQHKAGGIAGENAGTILGCTNEGEINTEYIETNEQTRNSLASNLSSLSSFDVSSVSAEDFVDIMDVGGIAGYSTGLISECRNQSPVGYGHTGYNVGGIAGRSTGFIVSCTNEAAVTGRKDVGGILGQLEPESIWEYSRGQMDDLKDQLIHLNELLDTLASDVADSSAAVRDGIHTAAGYADNTIRDLEDITETIRFDVEATSATIKELMQQLQTAFDEENAQAMGSAIRDLARVLSETDFFSLPVYVDVKGDSATELNSVLNARESDWWRKLDEYLNSRQSTRAQGATLPVPQPSAPSGGSTQAASASDSALPELPGNEAVVPDEDYSSGMIDDTSGTSSSDGAASDPYASDAAGTDPYASDGSGEDSYVVDDSIPDAIEPDPGYVDAPADAGYVDAAAAGVDEYASGYADPGYADPGYVDPGYVDPGYVDEGYVEEGYADEGYVDDGYVEPAGDVIAEEAVLTGSADDPEGAEVIVPDDASLAEPVLDYSSAYDRSLESGDRTLAGSSRNSNVQVSVNTDLPDTSQLRSLISRILTDSTALLDPVALSNAEQILKDLQLTVPDTKTFYQDFRGLAASVTPIADEVHGMTRKAAADIDAITDQLNVIIETFFDLTQNITLDEKYTEKDISEQNPYQSDSSSVENCRNEGAVSGDTNIGGVAGCIGFENQIDAEGVLDLSQYLLKDAQYTIFASVRKCTSEGPATAKKESAGGICAFMEFGIVTDSVNTGAVRVEDGDYCGGISGKSRGTITSCCAGSLVSGNAYVGGIAGQGTNISGCISYSYLGGGREYLGAVAGSADGQVSGCRYVDYGVGGVDNVGYEGAAQPVRVSLPMPSEGEHPGSYVTVTFDVEGETFREVRVPFGTGLETLPEVPNKGDDFWVWDDFDQEHIFSDQTVTGSYHRATMTLSSPGDVPRYLAEGVFYEGQKLTVEDFEVQDSPVSTESLVDMVEERLNGSAEDAAQASTEAEAQAPAESAATKLPETETEEEAGGRLARAGREIRRVITDRLTGPLVDAKTLSVNDYDKDLTVRVRAEAGGRLFTAPKDGTLTETDYEKDGSYIVFPLPNGGSFAYYESIRQNKDMRGRIAVICIVLAAACVLVILLAIRHRKRRKQKKNSGQGSSRQTGNAQGSSDQKNSETQGSD